MCVKDKLDTLVAKVNLVVPSEKKQKQSEIRKTRT